uniref:PIPK domain-containing protein n=1 Tax=Plectus sambesii TaxID=2011161 RepID=A0A914UWZ1_9BILA
MSSRKKKTPRSLGKPFRGKGKPLVPKWKLFRANEPLLSVFMWGVNHSITDLSHVPPPGLLMPDDFKAYSKIKVDNHAFNKENMPSHFKVKEYCPNVFRNLRERFGVDESEYLTSLTEQEPRRSIDDPRRLLFSYDQRLCIKVITGDEVANAAPILIKYHQVRSLTNYQPEATSTEPTGKGVSRLFVSYDKKLVIKTMDTEAVAEMHSILRDYHEYVVEKHGKTLLPQYLGLYRLTVDGNETYLIVMRNIFGRKYKVHRKYDLKGSTVQRQASEKEKSKELPTYKDNDFLEDQCKLNLPADAKTKLIDMLSADTAFLSRLHLMDYSLLVGIHDCDKALEEAKAADAAAASTATAVGGATGDSSEPDLEAGSADEFQPTPPDSPIPSTGAFAPYPTEGGVELDDEFYAIPSNPNASQREIYFIGLVDILTYYGVKKRTASAAKSVKYGSEAENISTVKPEQYGRRLLEFVTKAVSAGDG